MFVFVFVVPTKQVIIKGNQRTYTVFDKMNDDDDDDEEDDIMMMMKRLEDESLERCVGKNMVGARCLWVVQSIPARCQSRCSGDLCLGGIIAVVHEAAVSVE